MRISLNTFKFFTANFASSTPLSVSFPVAIKKIAEIFIQIYGEVMNKPHSMLIVQRSEQL